MAKVSQREAGRRRIEERKRIPEGRPVAFSQHVAHLPATLVELERSHILGTVGWANGDLDVAAIALGIDRRTLEARLRRYGVMPKLRRGPKPKARG